LTPKLRRLLREKGLKHELDALVISGDLPPATFRALMMSVASFNFKIEAMYAKLSYQYAFLEERPGDNVAKLFKLFLSVNYELS
jgi:hypothetical protein